MCKLPQGCRWGLFFKEYEDHWPTRWPTSQNQTVRGSLDQNRHVALIHASFRQCLGWQHWREDLDLLNLKPSSLYLLIDYRAHLPKSKSRLQSMSQTINTTEQLTLFSVHAVWRDNDNIIHKHTYSYLLDDIKEDAFSAWGCLGHLLTQKVWRLEVVLSFLAPRRNPIWPNHLVVWQRYRANHQSITIIIQVHCDLFWLYLDRYRIDYSKDFVLNFHEPVWFTFIFSSNQEGRRKVFSWPIFRVPQLPGAEFSTSKICSHLMVSNCCVNCWRLWTVVDCQCSRCCCSSQKSMQGCHRVFRLGEGIWSANRWYNYKKRCNLVGKFHKEPPSCFIVDCK